MYIQVFIPMKIAMVGHKPRSGPIHHVICTLHVGAPLMFGHISIYIYISHVPTKNHHLAVGSCSFHGTILVNSMCYWKSPLCSRCSKKHTAMELMDHHKFGSEHHLYLCGLIALPESITFCWSKSLSWSIERARRSRNTSTATVHAEPPCPDTSSMLPCAGRSRFSNGEPSIKTIDERGLVNGGFLK